MSRIVEGMSKKNLVKRVKNTSDSRFSKIILTKKGNELKAHLPNIFEKFNALATKGLSPIEVRELQRMLEHVYSNTGLNK
jgi:DNA-binding MarR family transcriptional regulator